MLIHTEEKTYGKLIHTGEQPYIYDFIKDRFTKILPPVKPIG